MKTLSSAVAELLGKPESHVLISLTTDKPMSYGGSEDPCAYAELICIGMLGLEPNKTISAKLSAIVKEKLGVEPNRFGIKFYDIAGENFGRNGTTFAGMS